MNERDFCMWLNGFLELRDTIDHREGLSEETVKCIRDHLGLVFKKVTPDRSLSTIQAPFNPPTTTLPFPTPGFGIGLDNIVDKNNPPVIMC